MTNSSDYILANLSEFLIESNQKVVVAESCTGGGVARKMTELPGSSAWFDRGFVTYSNESKIELLGVNQETLQIFGAVSVETATEMSEGALASSHAQLAVAVTGIAGPDGGTDDKPVGTVCFAWSATGCPTVNTMLRFSGDRHEIREQATMMAIQGLYELVEKMEHNDN